MKIRWPLGPSHFQKWQPREQIPTPAPAPHDPRLNDVRWLVGESLRRTHQRAPRPMRAVAPTRWPAPGPFRQCETALVASDKLREAAEKVGAHAWPIVTRIVTEGVGVRDAAGFIPEVTSPWRAGAVVSAAQRRARSIRSAGGGEPRRKSREAKSPLSD
jgi:hypothetical protein